MDSLPHLVLALDEPAPFCIEDLPEELLLSVFHQVPWQERFGLEAVCRRWQALARQQGWNDVKGLVLDRGINHQMHTTVELLKLHKALSRCGRQLQWLYARTLEPEEWMLRLCPNVRHLRLGDVDLTQRLLDSMRKLYSGKLVSLVIDEDDEVDYEGPSERELAALNGLLAASSACLEFVAIKRNKLVLVNIALPDHLRVLEMTYWKDISPTRLSRRHQRLRSLTLTVYGEVQFSSLQHLSLLEHLELRFQNSKMVKSTQRSESKLIDTLPHLVNLKSLVVDGGTPQLMEVIGHHCPQLEHLGWKRPYDQASSREARVETLNLIGARLEKLRSLMISDMGWWPKFKNWGWLEAIVERGRLEYLFIDKKIPPDVLYMTIRKSPKLAVISTIGKYTAAKIASVAAETAAASQGVPFPRMHIHLHMNRTQREMMWLGRVVILDQLEHKAPKSHILHHYRYGCLSEGKPRWESIK